MARGLGTHVSSERAKAPGGKGVTEGAIWSLTLVASQAVGATEDLDTVKGSTGERSRFTC
jgi:hypothetical protein